MTGYPSYSVRDLSYGELLRQRRECADAKLWTANRDTIDYYDQRLDDICAELMRRGPYLQNTGLPAVRDE